jgi:Domain of unknown function (DUF4304)
VNLQKSKWNTADEVRFTINLALVPKPWFEWHQKQYQLPESSKPREHDGLWWERLRPNPELSRDGEFWRIIDPATAKACAADVADRLDRVGLPRLLELLDRDSLMRAIQAGDFGFIKRSPHMPLAILLSDSGPGQELEEAIANWNLN